MRTIEEFMTPLVFTIARERTLEEAHQLMRAHQLRHLPVLHGGELVGMVTERDLTFIETLKSTDPKLVRVDDAMSEDVFSVSRDAPLVEVARRMASDKLGSAVVLEGRKIVGIFTAIDALRALETILTVSSPQKATS